MNEVSIAARISAGLMVGLVAVAGATPNQEGLVGANKTHSAATLGKGRLQASVYTHIINDEQLFDGQVVTRSGRTEQPSYFLLANSYLNLAYGLSDDWDLGVNLPVYYEEVQTSLNSEAGNALGDVKLLAKYRMPWMDSKSAWGVSLIGGVTVPTSKKGLGMVPREMEYIPRNGAGRSEGSAAFGPDVPEFLLSAALTGDFTKLAAPVPLLWHVNAGVRKVGYEFGDDREFDDVLSASTALEYRIHEYFGVFGELYHEARFDQIWESAQWDKDPTTFTFSAVVNTPVGLTFQAGMVFGMLRDGSSPVVHTNEDGDALESFGLKGSVPVSMVFGVSWNGQVGVIDIDKDGIADNLDKCVTEAEDKDGFEDQDGCPESDNDKDGIADAMDKCPLQAEDLDGFQDADGCADPDNDNDGIADLKDKCPMEAGTGDAEGCPNRDIDNDGIANELDKCPKEPEDKDGFEDTDGCIDADNDKDGIADALDKCPLEAEVVNQFKDEDGCPDEVIKKGEKLVLKGVFFKTASAELTPESLPTLDKLAEQLIAFPEVKLEVQGHTDNVGPASKNKKLSAKRAEAVVAYLVTKGIAKDRLKAFGYGPEKPMGDNKTEDGRAMNRRVELLRND
ncbi:MAG: ompA [Fibrobacteres bacterium]|nr:ompA [Fibrobacterota bacterium]